MTDINMIELTNKIKKKSIDIGFDLVGICSAEPFERAFSVLKNRKLSEFIKDDRKLLTDPEKHLSSVKSIISLGLSYANELNIDEREEQYIALYARGIDYHNVMKKITNKLIDFLKKQKKNLEYVFYSDTGTILDREIAYRAGLGWIGKSNNLINEKYGSYLILGEILTNLNLVYDKPVESKCGNCKLCIDNCPVQALTEFNLQADKCLSYLTQKKGFLSEEERKSIGNKLWGCDKCLEVCPYNKEIPVNIHKDFYPVLKGELKKVLGFTKDNFPKEWKKSALSWRGLRILKRNTIINIANKGDNAYIPLLKKELKNPSPVIRAYSAWALGQLGDYSMKYFLKNYYQKERNKTVKEEIKKIFFNNEWSDLDD